MLSTVCLKLCLDTRLVAFLPFIGVDGVQHVLCVVVLVVGVQLSIVISSDLFHIELWW